MKRLCRRSVDLPSGQFETGDRWEFRRKQTALQSTRHVSEPLATLAQEALDHLLAIIAKDRIWNDKAARKQLVQLFEAWGPKDEATLEGRRRLSSILFS